MAEQLDPEEWAEIMNEAFEYLTVPVERYEGTVARLMGDAILVFFGAPVAHEDDPQRAILAGLDIVEEIGPFRQRIESEYGLDFQVRVGINTGPVVVGEVGSAVAGEYTAMGDAVNLAARMEQSAVPGTVQVSEETRTLAAPLFDFETLGGIEVKGKAEPVPAYRVIGRKAEPGRLRGIEGLKAEMIGRGREIETLRRLIDELRQGRGQIACIVGEAGLGKSRLIEELRADWERNGQAPWIECRGISYETSRPYGLFLQQLHQACKVEDGDPPEVVHEKVLGTFKRLTPDLGALATLAIDMLLASGGESQEPQAQGEALKRELFEAALALWREVASQKPLVMVFDDVHWADPASAELLLHSLQLAEQVPILFICAFRPERTSPAWRVKQTADAEYPHLYTEITLSPLSNEDSNALVDGLLTISDLPAGLRRLILSKAEGNPFFVEEVVRTLIDSEAVTRDETGMRWQAKTRVEDVAIPDNLQSLLISRFDRLEEATRRTLQLASVIGRSFYYKVLEIVSDAAVQLDRQLSTLQRVDLIREAARLPELEYAFRHELTREAAYNSILRRRRREFHSSVGEAIEKLFPDQPEEHAHRLAYHFDEARTSDKALKYYTMAGDAAGRVYANIEAITHYESAVKLAKTSETSNVHLIYLYTKLGRTLEVSGDHERALDVYRELESLAVERGQPDLELAALIPQATLHSTYTPSFDPEKGKTLSERTLELARSLEDHRAEAKALWNLMLVEMYGGHQPEKAVEHGEESLAIAREHNLREEMAYALNDLAKVYFMSGRPDDRGTALDEATELWRDLDNRPMLSDSLHAAAFTAHFAGDFDRALQAAKETFELSESIGNLWGQVGSLNTMGAVYLERGEIGKSVEALETTIRMGEQISTTGAMDERVMLGWFYGILGDPERGLDLVQKSLADNKDVEMVRQMAMAIISHLQLLIGNNAEAESAFEDAFEGFSVIGKDINSLIGILNLIACEFALHNGEFDKLLELADQTFEARNALGTRLFLGDFLRFRGQALVGLKRLEEARESLAAARKEAESQGSRRALWLVLSDLADFEAQHGDASEAARVRHDAREVIDFMSDQAGSPELRASFLALPHVRAVMGAS